MIPGMKTGKSLKWGKSPLYGLLLGSALIGAVFLIEIIAGWIKVEGFNFNPSLFLQFLVLQVLVSAGEELSFRGYILKNLIDETGIKNGIILSSVMFSAFLQYNVFALVLSQPGLMDSRILKTSFLTGGSYGPEAGITGFVVVFLALLLFIKKYSNLVNPPGRDEL